MRAVLQRVGWARVLVDEQEVGRIGPGWLILLGIGPLDTASTAAKLVDKVVRLRAFEDASGRMNRSAEEVGAAFLVVSQFTLYADLSSGRRPSFTNAAPPELAAPLVEQVVALLRERGFSVATGRFGASMDVQLCNHGPVTFILEIDEG